MILFDLMQDLSKAFKFFSMAADQGWVDGQLQLGIMHYSMLTASSVYSVLIAMQVIVGLIAINGSVRLVF